jgi:hypothetical protein
MNNPNDESENENKKMKLIILTTITMLWKIISNPPKNLK